LIFFDEIDSLAMVALFLHQLAVVEILLQSRSGSGGLMSRVVSQLITELDLLMVEECVKL